MESGLFRYWFRTTIPNSSYCDNPPRRFLETTALAVTNLWVSTKLLDSLDMLQGTLSEISAP